MLRLRETARGGDVVLKWRRMNGEGRVFDDVGGVIYVYK
jgi:hypothetical protein